MSRAGFAARLSRWANRHRHLIGWVFILPWLVSLLWFDLLPLAGCFYLSGTNYSVGRVLPSWIGLSNYDAMLTRDHLFWLSLANTLYYIAFTVPLTVAASFSLALALNGQVPGRGIFRTVYYIPSVVPIIATSMIWLWIFHTQRGLLNQILTSVGLPRIGWLTNPLAAKPALIIMSLWGLGGQMIIFLAGLQGISRDLYESAAIDGAGSVSQVSYITIPLMTPTIFFNLIMGIISSFQVFTNAYVMTDGGPLNSTLFYMLHLYHKAFRYFQMGYAAAMAVLLFFLILTLTALVNRTSKQWVHFAGD